jgi:hypothetical protein
VEAGVDYLFLMRHADQRRGRLTASGRNSVESVASASPVREFVENLVPFMVDRDRWIDGPSRRR